MRTPMTAPSAGEADQTLAPRRAESSPAQHDKADDDGCDELVLAVRSRAQVTYPLQPTQLAELVRVAAMSATPAKMKLAEAQALHFAMNHVVHSLPPSREGSWEAIRKRMERHADESIEFQTFLTRLRETFLLGPRVSQEAISRLFALLRDGARRHSICVVQLIDFLRLAEAQLPMVLAVGPTKLAELQRFAGSMARTAPPPPPRRKPVPAPAPPDVLTSARLKKVQACMQAVAAVATPGGAFRPEVQYATLFRRLDWHHNGRLQPADWTQACREVFQLPASEFPDALLRSVFQVLEAHSTMLSRGSLDIHELIDFLKLAKYDVEKLLRGAQRKRT
jgi:hypothetical protein